MICTLDEGARLSCCMLRVSWSLFQRTWSTAPSCSRSFVTHTTREESSSDRTHLERFSDDQRRISMRFESKASNDRSLPTDGLTRLTTLDEPTYARAQFTGRQLLRSHPRVATRRLNATHVAAKLEWIERREPTSPCRSRKRLVQNYSYRHSASSERWKHLSSLSEAAHAHPNALGGIVPAVVRCWMLARARKRTTGAAARSRGRS
jgi:hypothetical protein